MNELEWVWCYKAGFGEPMVSLYGIKILSEESSEYSYVIVEGKKSKVFREDFEKFKFDYKKLTFTFTGGSTEGFIRKHK